MTPSHLDAVADWLHEQGFPFNWSTTLPAPACLRAPLAQRYLEETEADWRAGRYRKPDWIED